MKLKALLLFFLLSGFLHAQNFEWTLGLADNKKGVTLDFSRPLSLERGDTISIYIQSAVDCWLYIIAQDPNRDVAVFQSGQIKADEAFRTNPIQLLDSNGQDTIHIIVSREQEKILEARIDAFKKENAFRNGRNIINAALDLRRNILNLAEAPERPVQIGGAFRGFEDPQGLCYSGAEKYFKSILINH